MKTQSAESLVGQIGNQMFNEGQEDLFAMDFNSNKVNWILYEL